MADDAGWPVTVGRELAGSIDDVTRMAVGGTRADTEAQRRSDPLPVRILIWAAGAAATLSVVGAGILVFDPLVPGVAASSAPVISATGSSTDDASALPQLMNRAHAGQPLAQVRLAALYAAGEGGVSRDMKSARLWTRRAAEGGERAAMHLLGLYLIDGEGGAQDYVEASRWFRRAADRGVIESQYNLGFLYESGRGVDRDLREARRWYALAAKAGDVAARARQLELASQPTGSQRADAGRIAALAELKQASVADHDVGVPAS